MNRLVSETSPYLRQHADNPIDWYPWGDAAFAAARERGVPVFLSVGYSACHWCHVMAHESFESPTTAALMNELFVNVKVDREERPDIDAIYMQATQAMTGSGGWPMSVWLTPDGAPFHAGTYFPPEDRRGLPSLQRVAQAISQAWHERRAEVDELALNLTEAISVGLPATESAPVETAMFERAVAALRRDFDTEWGGFGRAPKFPQGPTLSFLARHDPDPLMLTTTLDAMACGGIYDHVGGGFARYSVDNEWLIAHFEKMLYDNALLIRAYTDGWLRTGNDRYRRIVAETIEWALRELRHGDGGFYSAYDADSEGVEGKYYAWSHTELQEVLGDRYEEFAAFYGVSEHGNFVDPHTRFSGNVLHIVHRDQEPSAELQSALSDLRARRALRVAPGCDDKVLLAWNALMVRALCEAGAAFSRPEWIVQARRTAQFLMTHLRRSDGRLLRSWQADATPVDGWGQDGRGRLLAYAQDYAALAEALTSLAEHDSIEWLTEARVAADALIALFHDTTDGGFFTTGSDAEQLIVRAKDQMDNATPSENSLAANALLRLGVIFDDESFRRIGTECVDRVAGLCDRHPTGFGYVMEAAARVAFASVEVVVVGSLGATSTEALQRAVHSRLSRNRVTLHHDPAQQLGIGSSLALLAGRGLVDGSATAYVCQQSACQLPVTTTTALSAQLDAVDPRY